MCTCMCPYTHIPTYTYTHYIYKYMHAHTQMHTHARARTQIDTQYTKHSTKLHLIPFKNSWLDINTLPLSIQYQHVAILSVLQGAGAEDDETMPHTYTIFTYIQIKFYNLISCHNAQQSNREQLTYTHKNNDSRHRSHDHAFCASSLYNVHMQGLLQVV